MKTFKIYFLGFILLYFNGILEDLIGKDILENFQIVSKYVMENFT